jgi:hypothetical protein
MNIVLLLFVLLFGTSTCFGDASEIEWGPIQDNSFLLEEAYNQEYGVVQHINAFRYFERGDDNWIYTFTQEWPVPGQKHQLSYTLPILNLNLLTEETGISDILLNYRYQLVGNGETKVAVAPRFSVVLSTGDELRGLGAGGSGYQVNLPVSIILHPQVASHWNAGLTHLPSAKNELRQEANTVSFNAGQSFIWQPTKRFNVLFEAAFESVETVVGADKTERTNVLFLNPGIRWAHNFQNGLQIVPGIAFPIGVGAHSENSVFLYLSFEHPLWH